MDLAKGLTTMAQTIKAGVLGAAALLSVSASHGETMTPMTNWFDGVMVSHGEDFASRADLRNHRVSLFSNWQTRWFNEGDWSIGGYFDLSFNHWQSRLSSKDANVSAKGKSDINAIAFSPVFRISRNSPLMGTWTPFAEAGIGLSYLSGDTLHAKDDDPVDLGMRLQFEDRIGFGFTFGDQQQYQIILRAFHYSNAGLHSENDGFNLQEIAFGYTF